MNFFLQGFDQTPVLSLIVKKQEQTSFDQAQLVALYAFIDKNYNLYT
jgi:hypothetical protein